MTGSLHSPQDRQIVLVAHPHQQRLYSYPALRCLDRPPMHDAPRRGGALLTLVAQTQVSQTLDSFAPLTYFVTLGHIHAQRTVVRHPVGANREGACWSTTLERSPEY